MHEAWLKVKKGGPWLVHQRSLGLNQMMDMILLSMLISTLSLFAFKLLTGYQAKILIKYD
jgi:hypothetical protein